MMKIGYLIPEFPGQTHIWMWREISHMRQWHVPITIFSTRRPAAENYARHSFAQSAAEETCYLWPRGFVELAVAMCWAALWRPRGFWRMLKLCFSLNLDRRPCWRTTLPLVPVAAVLAREAKTRGIQHFHSHTCARSAILAMMVKRLAGIPFSMTLNANIEWWGGAMQQKFSDAEFTIAITKWLLAEIQANYAELGTGKALLGRIGVDTRKWQPWQHSTRPLQDHFRVVTVGRLHASKGHDVLIRSIKLLVDEGRKVRLTIVGSGPEEAALISLAKQLSLADVVNFTGSLSEDQIIDQMQRSDAFVLASHAEPLGVVSMEAMAMGLPTIATAAGGVGEIITDQQDGLLVPPGDEQALSEAIRRLIDDPPLRRQLSENGRRTIVERFDSRLGAATLYERLFGKSPATEKAGEPVLPKSLAENVYGYSR